MASSSVLVTPPESSRILETLWRRLAAAIRIRETVEGSAISARGIGPGSALCRRNGARSGVDGPERRTDSVPGAGTLSDTRRVFRTLRFPPSFLAGASLTESLVLRVIDSQYPESPQNARRSRPLQLLSSGI